MDKSDAQFCAKHKNEDDHIQSHQRTVYDTAASSLYHLLRDISNDDLERVLLDDTLFQSLIRSHDKVELLVGAVYQRKTDVERSLAHSLAAASSHVGLDGHSTRHGNAHFAWQVLCRCMHANSGVLADMTAPESIIEALNRQVRNEPQAREEYEESIRRSAFSNLLQDQERLCLDAVIAELGKQGYEVGCKIFDGCLVRRKKAATLPASLVVACEAAVLRDTGLAMPLWEKCLICGDKLKCCSCK
eukprot:COSAG06_NODE_12879_length_1317_cov_1.055008_1_plen_245_part_00